jgi:hypothetical protein
MAKSQSGPKFLFYKSLGFKMKTIKGLSKIFNEFKNYSTVCFNEFNRDIKLVYIHVVRDNELQNW